MPKHEIRKERLDAIWRTLTVTSKQFLTPKMLRVHFQSEELQSFESPSPDDHVKLLLESGASDGQTVMRDFTPRAWDAAAGTFALEFALHSQGPAIKWAQSAQIGDTLQVGGPRGSVIVPDDFDWYLFVGDATALPSIARRLESLRAGVPVTVLALVENEAEMQTFPTMSKCNALWQLGGGDPEGDMSALLSTLAECAFPPGDGFIWAAGEAALARAVHAWATEERRQPAEWVKVAEYWRRG